MVLKFRKWHTCTHHWWSSYFSYCKCIRSGWWQRVCQAEDLLPQWWKGDLSTFSLTLSPPLIWTERAAIAFPLSLSFSLSLSLTLSHSYTLQVKPTFSASAFLGFMWPNSHGLLAVLMSLVFRLPSPGMWSTCLSAPLISDVTFFTLNLRPLVHPLISNFGVLINRHLKWTQLFSRLVSCCQRTQYSVPCRFTIQ